MPSPKAEAKLAKLAKSATAKPVLPSELIQRPPTPQVYARPIAQPMTQPQTQNWPHSWPREWSRAAPQPAPQPVPMPSPIVENPIEQPVNEIAPAPEPVPMPQPMPQPGAPLTGNFQPQYQPMPMPMRMPQPGAPLTGNFQPRFIGDGKFQYPGMIPNEQAARAAQATFNAGQGGRLGLTGPVNPVGMQALANLPVMIRK